MYMIKQNWWMKVSIALAVPLLARTYERMAGAGHGVDEGDVGRRRGVEKMISNNHLQRRIALSIAGIAVEIMVMVVGANLARAKVVAA